MATPLFDENVIKRNEKSVIRNYERSIHPTCANHRTKHATTPNTPVDLNLSGFVLTVLCYSFTAFLVLAAFILNCVFRAIFATGIFGSDNKPEPAEVCEEAGSVMSSRRSSVSSVTSSCSPPSSLPSSPFASPVMPRKMTIPSHEEWVSMTKHSRKPALCYGR